MASSSMSMCSLAVMVLSLALLVYAYYHIFQQKQSGESDLEVIQRQIRGFALLLVSNLVMLVGMALCAGSLLPALSHLLKQD